MNTIARSLLGATFVLSMCALARLAPSEERMIVTPSGAQIPYSALKAFHSDITQHFVDHHVFEITNDNRLIGFDLNEDLKSLPVAHHLGTQNEPPVRVDGKPVTLSSDATVHIGPRIAAVIDEYDQQVLFVWGQNLNLVPIGSGFHNVFVNTARYSENLIAAEPIKFGGLGNHESSNLQPSPQYISVSPDIEQPDQMFRSLNSITQVRDPQGSNCSNPYPKKTVEIAVAFNSLFCKKYNGNSRKTVSVLRALTQVASAPYENQTCLNLKPVHFDGYCNRTIDPYLTYGGTGPLEPAIEKFIRFWLKNRKDVHRDVAYLFSATFGTSTQLGIAAVGGACAPDRGYGMIGFPNPLVMAHEVGHNLGCDHTRFGIMRSYYGDGLRPKFSGASLWQLLNFVDNKPFLSSCLRKQGPTPTPIPIASKRKCNTSFSPKNVLVCRTFKLGKIPASLGFVEVSVKIAFNVLEVQTYVTYKQVSIYLIKSFVSLRSDLTIADVGDLFQFEKGARLIRQKWTMGDLFLPKNRSSCCGATYYVYVWTYACIKENECRNEYLVKPLVLPCKDLCSGNSAKSVLPMSKQRKCPRCGTQK